MEKNETLKRQLLAKLTDRVHDRVFDLLSDAIGEELDTLYSDGMPDWVSAMSEEDQWELHYELAGRIVLTYG